MLTKKSPSYKKSLTYSYKNGSYMFNYDVFALLYTDVEAYINGTLQINV